MFPVAFRCAGEELMLSPASVSMPCTEFERYCEPGLDGDLSSENGFKRLPLPPRRPEWARGVSFEVRLPASTVLLGLKSGVLSSSDSDDSAAVAWIESIVVGEIMSRRPA